MAIAAPLAALVSTGSGVAGAAGLISATTAGIIGTAATALGTYVTGAAEASAQKDAQKAYNKALLQSTIDGYKDLDKQESEIIYDAHIKSIGAQKELLRARSSVEANAAATGTAGNSVNVAINDLGRGYGERIADVTHEMNSRFDSVNQEALNLKKSYEAQQDTKRIKGPSIFSALASGAQAGISTYNFANTVGAARRSISSARSSVASSANKLESFHARIGKI